MLNMINLLDGMAYYENFMRWCDKSKNASKEMLESFANTCRNEKVGYLNTHIRCFDP